MRDSKKSEQPGGMPGGISSISWVNRIVGSYEFKLSIAIAGLFVIAHYIPLQLYGVGLSYITSVLALQAFLVIPMTLLLFTGNIDLSIESVMWVSFTIYSGLIYHNFPAAIAIACPLLVSVGLGCANGFLITKLNFPSWIVTLATWWLIPSLFNWLKIVFYTSFGYLFYFEQWKTYFNYQSPTISPYLVGVVFFGLALSFFIVQSHRPGQALTTHSLTRFTKIRDSFLGNKLYLFTFSGLVAGLVGVLYQSTGIDLSPYYFSPITFTILAACLIGGCSIWGGYGSIPGSFLGVLFLWLLTALVPRTGLTLYLGGGQAISDLFLLPIIFFNACYLRNHGRKAKINGE